MNITRRPNFRYPDSRLLTIVLALSLTVMVGLATESKPDLTRTIAELVPTCDSCSSALASYPNTTLN